ncbi:MAG: YbaB/EbfC family nucleoid-associated protein [Clostridia bacterium]|nr:YbaB/EbfC family nucleoid-associated protein [Clostridia bacterium]MBR3955802.1 YbaB/EbfC family nucleoid-associated protein [Clostridia bacterium]
MKARIPNQPNRNEMMMRIQKMQEEMQRVQEEVENSEFSASAGGGAVEVTVTGKHEITSIKMKPEIVDPEDIDMLEDLLLASLNEAIRKANDTMEQTMNGVTGGLNIPGMGGLL